MENNNSNINKSELAKVQTIKVYLKDNIDKMLFSELVSALNLLELKEIALREIVKRMEFCNIDQTIAKRIIQVEKKVLENKEYNRPDSDYLVRKKWWDTENDIIFSENYNECILQFKNLSAKETLTLSDLIAITAEANHIDSLENKSDIYSEKVLKEINNFGLNGKEQKAFMEFKRRICFCYIWAYKDVNEGKEPSEEKMKEFEEKGINLFYNELRIVTKNKYNYVGEEWEPYTNEYFERETKKIAKPKIELKDIAIKVKEIVSENKEFINSSYKNYKVEEIENDLRKFKDDECLLINIVFICLCILSKQEYTKNSMINTLEKIIDGANEKERLENQANNLEAPFSNFPEVFASLDTKTKYFAKKTIEEILEKYDNNEDVI